MMKTTATISNKLGLHARASAKLTKLAGSYPCEVWLTRGERRVNAKSIMGVMMLAAGPYALPLIREAMEAGWQGDAVGALWCAPLASTYFNMRKTTIYGGSNEVQRNIVSQVVLG